jgi:hypothetical protein
MKLGGSSSSGLSGFSGISNNDPFAEIDNDTPATDLFGMGTASNSGGGLGLSGMGGGSLGGGNAGGLGGFSGGNPSNIGGGAAFPKP